MFRRNKRGMEMEEWLMVLVLALILIAVVVLAFRGIFRNILGVG